MTLDMEVQILRVAHQSSIVLHHVGPADQKRHLRLLQLFDHAAVKSDFFVVRLRENGRAGLCGSHF
jgi:hypothetical protein